MGKSMNDSTSMMEQSKNEKRDIFGKYLTITILLEYRKLQKNQKKMWKILIFNLIIKLYMNKWKKCGILKISL